MQPLVSTTAHALFFDQTHDNECPISKRSAYDIWPLAGMVAISNCAVGSNRGLDQMVPVHVSVCVHVCVWVCMCECVCGCGCLFYFSKNNTWVIIKCNIIYKLIYIIVTYHSHNPSSPHAPDQCGDRRAAVPVLDGAPRA